MTGPDGASDDCSMTLKVHYGGEDYELTTSKYVRFEKTLTELIGTTPDGERIEFHLSTSFWLVPGSTLYEGKWKLGLLNEPQINSAICTAFSAAPLRS